MQGGNYGKMKTILMDFDGVIHNHSTNDWKGIDIIEGQPVKGIKDCIKNLRTSMIVDDRAINFNGDCKKLIGDIENFKIWTNK